MNFQRQRDRAIADRDAINHKYKAALAEIERLQDEITKYQNRTEAQAGVSTRLEADAKRWQKAKRINPILLAAMAWLVSKQATKYTDEDAAMDVVTWEDINTAPKLD